MSVLLKCAACGHEVPFEDGAMDTEAICPGCEVMVRRRSAADLMAIPVSMELPESFGPADLEQVPKHSGTLVHRYQKQAPPHRTGGKMDPQAESNFALARAIERLASAIEHKAAGYAGLADTDLHQVLAPSGELAGEGHSATIPVLNREQAVEAPGHAGGHANGSSHKNGKNGMGNRSGPLPAKVLVRREAAAEAHRFRREIQAATDIRGVHRSKLTVWVEKHPLTMLFSGLALIIALVVMTAILMDGTNTYEEEGSTSGPVFSHQDIGEKELAGAEQQARGFLNAVALKAAQPYIFQSEQIQDKLAKYFEPISDPGDYDLQLRDRKSNEQRSVFFYQVTSGSQRIPLAVLEENGSYRVFWEFSYAIGDMSWDDFLSSKPANPTLMRAYLRPANNYDATHSVEEWSSWIAEGNGTNHRVQVFVKRNSAEERRLTSAYKINSVTRNRSSWVMGQVKLSCPISSLTGDNLVAEITEVPLASWLPEEFETGNTFYSEKELLKGNPKDRSGFQDSN